MAGLKPLGPAYPVNAPRRLKDDEERRRRLAESKRKRRKSGPSHGGKLDEYA